MITFLSVLLAPLVGIGLATMIIGVLLASNNIGDSVGDKICYAGTPRFIKSINNGRHSDCDNLVTGFQSGDAGNYNYSHHSSPHPYNKSTNTRKAKVSSLNNDIFADQFDFDEELPPIDTPIFKPLNKDDSSDTE